MSGALEQLQVTPGVPGQSHMVSPGVPLFAQTTAKGQSSDKAAGEVSDQLYVYYGSMTVLFIQRTFVFCLITSYIKVSSP